MLFFVAILSYAIKFKIYDLQRIAPLKWVYVIIITLIVVCLVKAWHLANVFQSSAPFVLFCWSFGDFTSKDSRISHGRQYPLLKILSKLDLR